MNFYGETYIQANQMQIWNVLGDLKRLPEWIDGRSMYLPPQEVTLTSGEVGQDSTWRMTAADGQVAEWRVVAYQPGILLAMGLSGIEGSPFTIEQYYHVFRLEFLELNLTKVEWELEFTLSYQGFWGWVERRVLHSQLCETFEWMINYSLVNLKNLVEGIYLPKPTLEEAEEYGPDTELAAME